MDWIAGLKAVSFDADGTLWDFQGTMRRSLGKALDELEKTDPLAATELTVDEMIQIRDRVARDLKGEISNHEKIRLEAFKETLRVAGRPDDALATHLTELYLRHRFGDIELYVDVLPTLGVLRKKYTLGIISNGNSHPDRCGLEGYFQFVVLSEDHGVEKPDPRIFEIALEEAGCSRGEILHVGDSEADIVGASEARIRCVWLNREGSDGGLDLKADIEIASLTEMVELLGA